MMTVQRRPTPREDDTQRSPSTVAPDVVRKPKKAPHNKVRTGCFTCRRRRVKCDEAKPLCRTCTKKGFDCSGYSRLDPLRLVVVPPPSSFRGRDEHQAFQFFMETTMTWFDLKTGPCIEECHVHEFWNPIVLQMTEHEPAIKHILLAWAELHRRILYEPMSPNEPFENDFFWQNHSQALKLLGSKKEVDMGVILIACIMFCILENFRGRRDAFLQHLQSGMRILKDYDQMSTNTKKSICETIITRYVRPMLNAFHINLSNILEFELLQPKVPMCDRIVKMKEAGRVIKTWN